MYLIYLDDLCLFSPSDEDYAVQSAVLNQTIGEAGFINVTIPETNPLYAKVEERKSLIRVLKDGAEIFRGEVREVRKNLLKDKEVYAVGVLSWLCDSIQPQKEWINESISTIFQEVLNEHNSQAQPHQRYARGIVMDESVVQNVKSNYQTTLEFIKAEILDKFNLYAKVRNVDGLNYLDLLKIENYGKTNNQQIKFGRNIIDYVDETLTDSIATACIPLGKKQDNQVIEGLDNYLTILGADGGAYDKIYVDDTAAVDSFGWIAKVVNFDDVDDKDVLKAKGEEWLNANKYANLSFTIKAVDLSNLKHNIDDFDIGDSVLINAPRFGINSRYYILEKQTDLLNFANNSIDIGNTIQLNYTKRQTKIDGNISDDIPEDAEFVQIAKESASELIRQSSEGNIYFLYDENGKPTDLLIMNTNDIKTATKLWRWNQNGLGYFPNGYGGNVNVAITMNGAIVADFITAGTIRGITLSGNTIAGNEIISESSQSKIKIDGGVITAEAKQYYAGMKITDKVGTETYTQLLDGQDMFSFNNSYYVDISSGGISVGTYSGKYQGYPNNRKVNVSLNFDGGIYGETLGIRGTKKRIVNSDIYGDLSLYSDETPNPTFTDYGEGETDGLGECYVFIDDVFAETIDTECEYQVFLQKYGEGDIYVAERTPIYFVVKGTENLKFGWQMKAVQRGYDSIRLDIDERPELETDYSDDIFGYLEGETEVDDIFADLFNDDFYEEDETNE